MNDKVELYVNNLKTLSRQVIKAYDDPNGNGIDQDQAVEIAHMFIELDQMLSSGMHAVPSGWNKSDFELGFSSSQG